MSNVIATPQSLATAAGDLAGIGSAIDAANTTAAAATTEVLAAGHAQAYQALSAQASAFHDRFVQALPAGAGSYARAEVAANASPLQAALAEINAPFQALTGRPLVGNGGDAGLIGNGGPGGTGGAGGRRPPGCRWRWWNRRHQRRRGRSRCVRHGRRAPGQPG
jgi:hypothetical protein